jgi:putative membrane protein
MNLSLRPLHRSTLAGALALTVVSLAACKKEGGEYGAAGSDSTAAAVATTDSAMAPAAGAPTTDTAAAAASTVTDPQNAAIVVAANDVDIAAGNLAKGKATNPRVKEFAETMIRDHGAVNKAATDLVTRLNVTPEPNATSQSLTQSGESKRTELQGLSGAAFDKAYVDSEVTYHAQVLDAIDKTLIPSAQNADLKKLLQDTRPAVAHHLDMARQLQASLESK